MHGVDFDGRTNSVASPGWYDRGDQPQMTRGAFSGVRSVQHCPVLSTLAKADPCN